MSDNTNNTKEIVTDGDKKTVDNENEYSWWQILSILNMILVLIFLVISVTTTRRLDRHLGQSGFIEPDVVDVNNIDLEATDEYSTFVFHVFDTNGSCYADKNNNTFYSDPDCTKEITNDNLVFISFKSITAYDSKGNSISCFLTENGHIVYIPSNMNVSLYLLD